MKCLLTFISKNSVSGFSAKPCNFKSVVDTVTAADGHVYPLLFNTAASLLVDGDISTV